MLRLVIEDDEGKTTVVPLIRDEITIGRKEGNTIRLTERNVSRRHARLLRTDGGAPTVMVEDLDSYNGVRLNGAKIADKAAFKPGDLLQIGDYQLALKSDDVQVDAPAVAAASAASATATSAIDIGAAATQVHHVSSEVLPADEQGRLVVVSSNLAGESYVLDRREIIVGRTDENEVVINHRSISRNHAKIIARDGTFTIIDLASSNGVKVNGEGFGTSTLVNGDIVELGHVKLRYVAPGDTYVFDRADIDDVQVDAGMPIGRLALILLVLAGVAVAAWFFVQPGRTDAEGSGTLSPTGGPTSGGTAVASAPESEPPAAPNTAAAAAVAAPSGPDAELQRAALLVEGREHLDARRWAEASGVFGRYLSDDPNHDEARRLKARADAEHRSERLFTEISADIRDKQFGDAYFKLADFPRDSTYWPELDGRRPAVESGYADEELERGRTLVEKQSDIVGARKVLERLDEQPFARKQSAALLKLIQKAEKDSVVAVGPESEPPAPASRVTTRPGTGSEPTERRRPRPPVPEANPIPPAPAGASYEQLVGEARKLWVNNEKLAAAAKLEEALKLNPRSKEPHQMLCALERLNGRLKRALDHCKLWNAKETAPSLRRQASERIKQLEQEVNP